MPEVDVVDSTWIGVPPALVAPLVAEPANWARWWPRLEVQPVELRGEKGARWRVRSAAGVRPAVAGSMEIWLQPADGGTIGHFFLRVDGRPGPLGVRARARLAGSYRRRAKRLFWGIGELVDPARLNRVAGPAAGIP